MAESKFGRRATLLGFLGLTGGALGLRTKRAHAVPPPGANAEFYRRCIRCFRCAEVCPPKAIRFDAMLDPRGSYTPYVAVKDTACVLCMKCTEVCPTGALEPIEPEFDTMQTEVKMGRPLLDRADCITLSKRGVCRLCFEVCPYAGSAVTLTGLGQGPAFFDDHCVGCGLCAEACPDGAKAISIIGLVRGAT